MALTDTVNKINRILGGLMSCELEFQPAEELVSGEWNLSELGTKINVDQPRFVESESSGEFGFPIHVDGAFAGLAVIKGNSGLKSDRLVLLADLLSEVLQSKMHQDDRDDDARIIEERLQVLQLADDEDSNVIPIRPTRLERVREMIAMLEQEEVGATEFNETEKNLVVTSVPLMIEALPGFPLQRLAVELHETSGRWAMLSLEDLASDTLESRENLKSLGGMTLFVQDLSALSELKQTKLAEYLATQPSAEMPQVIAGRGTGTVLPRLLNLMCTTRLNFGAEVNRADLAKAVVEVQENARKTTASKTANTINMAPFHPQYFDTDLLPVPPTVH